MPNEHDHASQAPESDQRAKAVPQAGQSDAGSPDNASAVKFDPNDRPKEYGGPKGPEPVRYGDWEKNGRCIDF